MTDRELGKEGGTGVAARPQCSTMAVLGDDGVADLG